jgi:hypothetical protein
MSEPDPAPLGAVGPFRTSTAVRTCFSKGVYTILTRHRTRPALAKTSAVACKNVSCRSRSGFFRSIGQPPGCRVDLPVLRPQPSRLKLRLLPATGWATISLSSRRTARLIPMARSPVEGLSISSSAMGWWITGWSVDARSSVTVARDRTFRVSSVSHVMAPTVTTKCGSWWVVRAGSNWCSTDDSISAGRQCLHQRSWMPNRARQRADPESVWSA